MSVEDGEWKFAEECRAEDPSFAELQARCRARARGETYSPEKHGPFEPKKKPKPGAPEPPSVGNLQDVIARFMAKGEYKHISRYATSPERPGARRLSAI